MSKRIWLASAVLLAAAAALAWMWLGTPRTVAVVHPKRGEAVEAVYATGSVEAAITVSLAPRAAGRLVSLEADEGQAVRPGQVLGRLEDADLQEATSQLLAQEELARLDFERKERLWKAGYLPKAELDQARATWEAAQAATRRAAAQAGFQQLIAPKDCTIIRRDGEIGAMIGANQPIFWLSCSPALRISAEVDEEDIPRVAAGQKVLIRADAFPGRVFEGAVEAITPRGDAVARSYRVRIRFGETTPLMIGMTAEANIVIREVADALLLPASALAGDGVWVVEQGRLTRRTVQVGIRGSDAVEITGGVVVDDEVVLTPDPTFTAGETVRTAPAGSP